MEELRGQGRVDGPTTLAEQTDWLRRWRPGLPNSREAAGTVLNGASRYLLLGLTAWVTPSTSSELVAQPRRTAMLSPQA